MKTRKILMFDLDGTLLHVDQEKFLQIYFEQLCKKICPYGYKSETLTEAVWKATNAMINNDGKKMNREVFWDTFSALMGQEVLHMQETFDSFYRNEFQETKNATWENVYAAKAVRNAKKRGYEVVLATNSVFPHCAVATRLSWIGLAPTEFSYITTYENAHYCKPNPRYYEEILLQLNARPCDCFMIGNDINEDIKACGKAGIDSFLVTDCVIGRAGDLSGIQSGTFVEMMKYLNIETEN